ncbi:uncharacterized protein LOC129216466 [Uloborus diversus]|uniref:uncharacterized protein LOC129216466 n=1 Tax=Uloborus diversus TaxID=327109 RepID=UPI0024095E50|nr:uncharacterized protein LOC129216466 [Uloborus diversus]
MVDITAKLFWYRTKEWYEVMADKLNDIVYTDDSKETVDVINLLLLGWILLGLIVYIVGNIIATQLRKKKAAFQSNEPETADDKPDATEHVSCAADDKSLVGGETFKEPEKLKESYTIPKCNGEDEEIVEWINNVFCWIYKQHVISPIIASLHSALNARTRLSSTEHGILVDFKDLIHSSQAPNIFSATEICNSQGDLNLYCVAEIEDLVFEIIVTQFKGKERIIIPYILNVNRISGGLNIICVPEDLTFITRFTEPPLIELSAELQKCDTLSHEDSQPLSDVVCEITTEALSSFIAEFKFSHYPDCPRLNLKRSVSEEDIFEPVKDESEERLLVKIIKANGLGGTEGCLKPYCVVEMDEPPQRYETKEMEEKHNPFWDESFTFIVKDVSAELLFEIYDKEKPSNENFLGLGIVSIEELIKNPSQRQIIPLQSRPLEDDDITGSLTTEFLFLNQTPVFETTRLTQANGDVLSNSEKTVETNSRITSGGTVITTTTIKRTKEENSDRSKAANLTANSISNYSSGHNLISLHEVEEEQIQNRNNSKQLNSFQKSHKNGDCIISNKSILTSFVNHQNFIEGDALDDNKNKDVENIVYTSIKSEDTALQNNIKSENSKEFENIHKNDQPALLNGRPDLAWPVLHVHDTFQNPDLIFDFTVEKVTDANCMQKEIDCHVKASTEMHELDKYVENSVNLSKDTDSTCTDMSFTLPPIAEIVEISSTSSKVLENQNDLEADLTGTALKELEKHSKPSSASKSTLIIHSVQRADNSVSESLEASPASHLSKGSRTSYSDSVPSSPSQDQSGDDRSRPKEKKSFMGSLRRRLSFRKTRSKSAENRSESASNYSQASSRSASTDRLRQQKPSPFKGKFMGKQFLAVPGSTRSSLSEASGISASSSRTYINENSTLVVETNENGIIKRYLIPNSLIHRSKWKKRGIKLHIYNDHVFVAKHLSGSTLCQVCQKYLTRRPGKQGYECRGCSLQCHKSCHVKAISYCSNSTISSMEVEYVHDPRSTVPKSS